MDAAVPISNAYCYGTPSACTQDCAYHSRYIYGGEPLEYMLSITLGKPACRYGVLSLYAPRTFRKMTHNVSAGIHGATCLQAAFAFIYGLGV
jgi:hypothetical protein